jgi:multicomponent Na+:H+ antiporter subunit C
MIELISDRYVDVLVLLLLAVGLYGMLAMRNLVKKIVGMVIFQTAIYLFFIEGSVVDGGTVPVIDEQVGTAGVAFMNPLPHLLILTAIVVGVAVVGVALSLLMSLYQTHGTLDEDEIIERLSE